jgi:hypothetical protein
MIHDIDLVLHLVRELPFRIEAAGTPVLTGKDRHRQRAAVVSERRGGQPHRQPRVAHPHPQDPHLHAGNLRVDRPGHDGAQVYRLPGGAAEPVADAEAFLARLQHESILDDGQDQLDAEHSAFLASAGGEAPNPVPGEDGRAALAVAMEVIGRWPSARGEPEPPFSWWPGRPPAIASGARWRPSSCGSGPAVELIGVGGPHMREAGVTLLHDYEEFAVLGIVEVIGKLPFFRRILARIRATFPHGSTRTLRADRLSRFQHAAWRPRLIRPGSRSSGT